MICELLTLSLLHFVGNISRYLVIKDNMATDASECIMQRWLGQVCQMTFTQVPEYINEMMMRLTCLMISRCMMFMTNPMSFGYMASD